MPRSRSRSRTRRFASDSEDDSDFGTAKITAKRHKGNRKYRQKGGKSSELTLSAEVIANLAKEVSLLMF